MNIDVAKLFLYIGGAILLIDALTSYMYVRDKRWFCQAVRLERLAFAVGVMILGVIL